MSETAMATESTQETRARAGKYLTFKLATDELDERVGAVGQPLLNAGIH